MTDQEAEVTTGHAHNTQKEQKDLDQVLNSLITNEFLFYCRKHVLQKSYEMYNCIIKTFLFYFQCLVIVIIHTAG